MNPNLNDEMNPPRASVWPEAAPGVGSAHAAREPQSEFGRLADGLRTLVVHAEAVLAEAVGKPAGSLRRTALPMLDQFVRRNPWRAVTLAAALGALAVCLLPRRSGPGAAGGADAPGPDREPVIRP